MSWGSYVDNLKCTGHIENAAIIGVADGSIWGQGTGLNMQPMEIDALLKGFGVSSSLSQTGIKLNGTKYFYLQSGEDHIQGKKGQAGITIGKSDKCMIIALYNEQQQPGNARVAVEKMVSYLRSVNY